VDSKSLKEFIMANEPRLSDAKPVKQIKSKKVWWIVSACVVGVGLAVLAFFLISDAIYNDSLMKGQTIVQGVTINGRDVSGMTTDQAMAATSDVPAEVLGKVDISIDVAGQAFKFNANDLSLGTNYNDVINQALAYAHSGTLEERRQAAETVKENGLGLAVNATAVRDSISAVLLPLKTQLDIAPVDATFTFTPWGYTANGMPYQPDTQAIIESCANGKVPEQPADLVRLTADQMPNKLRYQFWSTTKYIADYIPADANVARFLYKDGVDGRSVNMEAVIDKITEQVGKGDNTLIPAPVDPVKPAVTVDTLKAQTRLISSWTSSYSTHNNFNRNWNVAKLSGIINGVVIQPGETWSINDMTGIRTVSKGWKLAPGIIAGGYTMQPGGGVCQISSTTYNAAIRTGLYVVSASHHSIQSAYIPMGLDATISSPDPDLKLRNDYATPVYVVSYMNPADKNVTVEVYGVPPVDPEHGEVIYDFSFDNLGTWGTPTMLYYYNTPVAPDGTVIPEGTAYVYAEMRVGAKAQTYKHYLTIDGTEFNKEKFSYYQGRVINGKTYVNGPDPGTPPPVPTV
jgi:hypothetical protein